MLLLIIILYLGNSMGLINLSNGWLTVILLGLLGLSMIELKFTYKWFNKITK